METIKSRENPKIKQIMRLKKSRERRKQGLVIIEGRQEITLSLSGGVKLSALFLCEHFFSGKKADSFNVPSRNIFYVSRGIFEKISGREKGDGYLALGEPHQLKLENIKLGKNPLVIILDGLEKPGNLGAVCRTADAAGADAVIINNARSDIYHPNAIYASRGAVFTRQIVEAGVEETALWLKKHRIKSYVASPDAKEYYTNANFRHPSAIIVGEEHGGVSPEWLLKTDKKIKIPMRGTIDSLNVSVSAGLIIYEAIRQRATDK